MDLFGAKPLQSINRIIKVTEGILEGIPANNPAFTVFRGISYAKPPVGEYRWADAVDPESWVGVKRCDSFSPISIQSEQMEGSFYQKEFFPDVTPMSEDCLYLNIWTPDTTGTKSLPILFYIHGGAFISGFSWEMEFDGEAMCRRDCILITIGYRLGAMGFFAHPALSEKTTGRSGNYAISDCIQALKWVKRNAAAFGGNPENITVFGQSAGGAMVQSLITCPVAKGLFQRVIIQSAGGINTLGDGLSMQQVEKIGEEICNKLGKSLEELKKMDALEVTGAISNAMNELMGFGLHFNPCVDGYYQPKRSGDAIAAGEHLEVDIMTGTVSGDGGLFAGWPAKSVNDYKASMYDIYGELAEEYMNLYHVEEDKDLPAIYQKRAEVISLLAPRSWAFAEQKNKRKPLYLYYFDRKMPGDEAGAYHSSELWYIFGTIDRCWRSMEPGFTMGDYALSRTMTDYWCNFAKTGNPNGTTVPEWQSFTTENPMTIYLNEELIVSRNMGDVEWLDEHVRLQHKQFKI